MEKCSICLDMIRNDEHKTPCGHTFHMGCLSMNYIIDKKCPMCRAILDIPVCLYCNGCIFRNPVVLAPAGKKQSYHMDCIYSSAVKYNSIRDDVLFVTQMIDSIGMIMTYVYSDPIHDGHVVEAMRTALGGQLPRITSSVRTQIRSKLVIKTKEPEIEESVIDTY